MTGARARAAGALAVMALAASAVAGCNAAADADPTPVTTWKITPAAGRSATAPPSTPTAAATAPADATKPAGAATTLTLVGSNVQFDKTELSAPAGTVTIEFDNQDAGVLHNVHVFKGTSPSGESVGATKLEAGPVQQTLTLELAPGTYFYHCDAHPTTMKGTLSVS